MNKQVVIASVLAAASAQDGCDNAFTKAAREAKADIEAMKVTLVAETAALTAAAASEATAYNTAAGRVTTQDTIWTPLNTALVTATAAWQAQVDAQAAATSSETALATPVANALTATNGAIALQATEQAKVTAQDLIVAQLLTAVTDHTAEKALMTTALATATTAETAAIAAETAATTAKTTKSTEKTTAVTGQDAIETAKALVVTTKTTAVTSAKTAEQAVYLTTSGGYKAAKEANAKATLKAAYILAGCTFNDGTAKTCVGLTNDVVLALKTTEDALVVSTQSTLTNLASNQAAEVTKVATAESELATAQAEKDIATDNVTTITSAITTLTQTETTATSAKTTAIGEKNTAQTNLDTVTSQLAQAILDQTRGNTLRATLAAAVVPFTDDVVVKTYLQKIQDDLLAIQVAAKATAGGKIADLLNVKTLAEATLNRAATTKAFYDGLSATALASKNASDSLVTVNASSILAADAHLVSADAKIAMFVAECKEGGYDKAQDAKKAATDEVAAQLAAYTTIKSDYDAKAAFSTTGEANTICAYPAKATDAAQEPRPACKDGFCCGAAQKFLKDGTKLAIETCQTQGSHTYQYYPPLPATAVAEPTPETWRFQCISGAQKLAAAATAALAASYMMA